MYIALRQRRCVVATTQSGGGSTGKGNAGSLSLKKDGMIFPMTEISIKADSNFQHFEDGSNLAVETQISGSLLNNGC